MTLFDSSSESLAPERGGRARAGPASIPSWRSCSRRRSAYARLTRGTFDVTVGPLVALWIDAAGRARRPSARKRSRGRGRGSARPDPGRGRPGRAARAGAAVDLGGDRQGLCARPHAPLLRARHRQRAARLRPEQHAGALGAPPGADGLAPARARPGRRGARGGHALDQALSVSGSFGHSIEIGGRRYGHVIDPRSGLPLERRRQAVVVARNATLAEALSKALLILGEKEGIALVAAQAGCEGMLVDAEGGSWETPGWRAAVRFEPLASSP